MLSIYLKNIQAISLAEISLEEGSITEFVGDNSNGKSILTKITQAITSGDIKHKSTRLPLIKDGCSLGVVGFTRGNKQLAFQIAEEQADCVVLYNSNYPDDSAQVVMGIADKGVEKAIHDFGFRTYADGEICIQLAPTYGAIPFVTTSGSINGKIIKDITVDNVAESFIKAYENFTQPVFKRKLESIDNDIKTLSDTLELLQYYDYKEYEVLDQELQTAFQIMSGYNYIDFEEVDATAGDIVTVAPLKVKTYDRFVVMEPPIKELTELCTILEGTCPTCGKKLYEA